MKIEIKLGYKESKQSGILWICVGRFDYKDFLCETPFFLRSWLI